jgi:hypothetical protein
MAIKLVVNSVGTATETEPIAITVEAGSAGTVSLSMEEGYQLPGGICGLIEDIETGDVAAIGGEPMVVELEPFQVCENRFALTFMTTPVFEATAYQCEGGILHFNGERDITHRLVVLVGLQPVDNFECIFPETDCDCDGVMTTLDLLTLLPKFGAWCE